MPNTTPTTIAVSRAAAAGRIPLGMALGMVIGCDSGDSDCAEGHEAGFCAEDYRCLEGLECRSKRGVEAGPADSDNSSASSRGDDDDGTPTDNVAACQALVDSWECQPPGGIDLLMRDAFEDSQRDVSDDFNCLADNTSCSDDVLDASGWTQCAELAECA